MPGHAVGSSRHRHWLEVFSHLARGADEAADVHGVLGRALLETLGASASTWNVVSADWVGEVAGLWTVEPLPDVPEFERVPDPTWQPLLHWYATTGADLPQSVHRMPSTMLTSRRSAEWSAFATPLRIERQLSVPVRLPSSPHSAFVVARPGDDFDDDDLALVRLVQPMLTAAVLQHEALRGLPPPVDRMGLTDRELAALSLVATGLTSAAAARALGISPRTMHKHLENTYRKLGARDRVTALRRARDGGLEPLLDAVREGRR